MSKQAPEYKHYQRSAIAEVADWTPGFDMAGVSISDADKQAGSPKVGDKIARNPKNHADRWLIAADYFADNFMPVAAQPTPAAADDLLAMLNTLLDETPIDFVGTGSVREAWKEKAQWDLKVAALRLAIEKQSAELARLYGALAIPR